MPRMTGPFVERSVTVLIMALFSGTVLPPLLVSGGSLPIEPESSGVLAVFGVLYLFILGLIAVRPSLAPRLATASPLASALVLLAFASALWSIEPEITLRRAIAFLFTTLFGVYLGLRYPFVEIVRMIAIAMGILLVLSLAAVVAMPEVGVDHFLHAGAWKGVFFQKNVTGRAMLWLILSLLWLQARGARPRWLVRLGLAGGVLLLVLCGSGTSLLAAMVAAGVLLATRGARVEVRTLLPAAAALALLGLVAGIAMTVFPEEVLSAFGRDPTLTGRTELWEHTLASIAERPVQGWGYGAYWYGDHGPAAVYTVGWGIASAHNGWIDVTLDLGLGGLLLVAGLLLGVLVPGFLAVRYGGDPAAAWILAMGCATALVSLSESIFMERHSMNWVVLVMGSVALGRLPRRRRSTARPAGTGGAPAGQVWGGSP